VKAVIMAGGEGSRLRPLTCDRPKPLVPVCNRPVMAYTLDLLAAHGFDEVYVTLGYLPEQIVDQFGERHDRMRLFYTREETPLGTAGGVGVLRDNLTETFLVISGDALTDCDLTALLRFHRERRALATLALARVENPLEYGVVMTDPRGRVRRFLEKPGWGEVFSDLVNTGIYVLEPQALTGIPEGRPYDFSRDLFPALLATGAGVYGCVAGGYWCDIGDLPAYIQANLDLLGRRLRFVPPVQPACPGAVLEEAVIGPGCRIASGAAIRHSVLWAGVEVGQGALLQGAVLCEGAKVGAGASIYAGAALGGGAFVGAGATVCPGVRLWPGRLVEDGARAESHLIVAPVQASRLLRGGLLAGLLGQDLLPETVVRAGTAFASLLGALGPIVVGADGGRAGNLLKQAFACGAMAGGRLVLDAGPTVSPVTQHAVACAGAAGGFHVRCGTDGRTVAVFFGPEGTCPGRDLHRKLEQALSRHDFARAGPEAAGTVEPLPGAGARYLESLTRLADARRIRSAGLTVRLDAPGWTLIPRWAALLGCRLTVGPRADVMAAIDPLTAELRLGGVSPEQMLTLETLVAVRSRRPPADVVAVPVTAPRAVEAVLSGAGRRIRRIRRDEYSPVDPLRLLTDLLDWMAREGVTQAEIVRRLPEARVASFTIPCPWARKGRVMRRLLEEHQDQAVELIDGLRIQRRDGWVLILPDPDDPVYRVYAEGTDPERIAEAYCNRLEQLISQAD
jgi:mannose-1-phosphate guanylyltransferase / phosphomannomutase